MRSVVSYKLAQGIAEVGVDLCFEDGMWGAWAVRKKLCDDLVRAGHDELAGRALMHGRVNNSTKDHCYKKSVRDYDIGAVATGEAMKPMDDLYHVLVHVHNMPPVAPPVLLRAPYK